MSPLSPLFSSLPWAPCFVSAYVMHMWPHASLCEAARTAVLRAALHLWKTDESSPYVTQRDSPLVAVGIYLSRAGATEMKHPLSTRLVRLRWSLVRLNWSLRCTSCSISTWRHLKTLADWQWNWLALPIAMGTSATWSVTCHLLRCRCSDLEWWLPRLNWRTTRGLHCKARLRVRPVRLLKRRRLKVNLKVAGLSLGSTDTVVTLQRHWEDWAHWAD